ncbi:MAG: tetratricopeptide repeat protein [Deltaproteobacteria bacterium]|nr:tetratricopeptide repeat protein [Deltaproteobacteria bacterium]
MATASPTSSDKWLQGPVSDVVLGGGLLYIPILLLLTLGGPGLRDALPLLLVPMILLVCMNAHLGATMVRIYENAEDRRHYAFFAIYVSLTVAAVGLASLFLPHVGSIFLTFYLSLVPWHFTGQNYGVALILLRRHGVEIDPALKRYIYAAFSLPFALWILALHGARPAGVEFALVDTVGTQFKFMPIGIPGSIQGPAIIAAILAYLWVLGECFLRIRGQVSFREVFPGAVLFFSQALWFAVPVVARIFIAPERMGPFSPGSASFTFLWVAVMHGIQYLWITSYYIKRERPGTKAPQFIAKAMLMGTAIYGIPVLVLAPLLTGRVSFGGLELILVATISVHHFLIDGAIWKLRNTRVATILLRGAKENGPAVTTSGRHWVKALVLASGVLGIAFTLLGPAERRYGVEHGLEDGNLERIQAATKRLRWMGRDDSGVRAQLGYLLAQQSDTEGALREFERSNALEPNALAWTNIGALHERKGKIGAALSAYDTALALEPDNIDALHYAGRASLKAGRRDTARKHLERAVSLAPDRGDIRTTLAGASES